MNMNQRHYFGYESSYYLNSVVNEFFLLPFVCILSIIWWPECCHLEAINDNSIHTHVKKERVSKESRLMNLLFCQKNDQFTFKGKRIFGVKKVIFLNFFSYRKKKHFQNRCIIIRWYHYHQWVKKNLTTSVVHLNLIALLEGKKTVGA